MGLGLGAEDKNREETKGGNSVLSEGIGRETDRCARVSAASLSAPPAMLPRAERDWGVSAAVAAA